MGYKTIRQANDLIANLPAYVGKLKGAESWIAEAKFIRAYVYFAMVKRYGGVPILETPQEMTNDEKALWVARSSHEECIDFILSDLDYAIENLGKTKLQAVLIILMWQQLLSHVLLCMLALLPVMDRHLIILEVKVAKCLPVFLKEEQTITLCKPIKHPKL